MPPSSRLFILSFFTVATACNLIDDAADGIDDEAKSTECWLQQWRLRHQKRKTKLDYIVKDSRQVLEAIATDSATRLSRGSCLKWKISTSCLGRRLAIVVSCVTVKRQ
ncbi:hypothetical protein SLE2022_121080 [Rubroshorea leprosula]